MNEIPKTLDEMFKDAKGYASIKTATAKVQKLAGVIDPTDGLAFATNKEGKIVPVILVRNSCSKTVIGAVIHNGVAVWG